MSEESDKRSALRQPVLKGAKAQFDNAVVDCLVLDFSVHGARVSVDGFVPFPERLVLELRTGSRWHATRRWQRGTEVGLELTGFAGLNMPAGAKAADCCRDIGNSGVRAIVLQLEQERFFDYPALKAAAERLDAAALALEALLREAAGLR